MITKLKKKNCRFGETTIHIINKKSIDNTKQ